MQFEQNDPVSGPQHLCVRALEVRSVREETREAEFVASTDAIDSFGERVEQSWDLRRFKSNPVILWAHQSRELPIGQAKSIGMKDGQLHVAIKFASEKANPKAEQVWQSVREGTLRAVSVGFVPGDVRSEKQNGSDVVVLSKNDLYEVSVTPIPANPEALAKMRARAMQNSGAIAPTTENIMSEDRIKALEAKLTERDAAITVAEKRASEAETKSKALESQNAVLVTERDAAIAAQRGAEKRSVEAEVEALVGVKFSKEERDAQVELACSNRPLFDKLLSQRIDMPAARDLTGQGPVVGDDPTPTEQRSATDDNGASLEAEIQKAMEA
jgi:HK97 family phage prohead protease